MKKRLNINGEIVEMSFEQAYEQFAAFRHKMVSKWSYIPIGLDDLIQEGDIAFYRAYKSYNEDLNKEVGFLTYAHRVVDRRFMHLVRDINFSNRKSDFNTVSYNVMISEEKGDGTFLDFLSWDESFEYGTCESLDIKIAIEKLSERDKKIILMFMRGDSQAEIGKQLNHSQPQISRIKTKIIKKLREEIAS